jgi:hypothetical protein
VIKIDLRRRVIPALIPVLLPILLSSVVLSGCAKKEVASTAPTGRWGYINKGGNFIIQPQFDDASDFGEHGAIVRDGKRLLRLKQDPPGESSDPVKADDKAEQPDLPTLRATNISDDTYKILDGDKVVFEPGKVEVSESVFHDNDFVCVRFGEQYAFIDRNGKLGITAPFKAARDFSDKRAAVMDGGKWGFINRKGTFVIPAKYIGAGSFKNGLAPVKVQMEVPSEKKGLF